MSTPRFPWSNAIRAVKSKAKSKAKAKPSTPHSIAGSATATSRFFQHRCWIVLCFLLASSSSTSCSFSNNNHTFLVTPVSAYNNNNNNNNNNYNNHNIVNGIMKGAWKSQGKSQKDLVDQLFKKRIVQTDAVRSVMEAVDRGNYCGRLDGREQQYQQRDRDRDRDACYWDGPLSIGLGQTISAPHMHAYALEALYPALAKSGDDRNSNNNNNNNRKGLRILDVGCGSGYLTACFGRWCAGQTSGGGINDDDNNNNHKVFGIDVHKGLVDLSIRNMRRADGDLLDSGIVDISLNDGWKGLPSEAPFDAIHVGAAAETLPRALAAQLRVGGLMIIPIGSQFSSQAQVLYQIRRIAAPPPAASSSAPSASSGNGDHNGDDSFREEDYEITSLLGVRYVPLVRDKPL